MAPTEPATDLRLRPLTADDCDAGQRLSAEAGWNQNAADWRYLLASGLGWGFEDSGGRLGATAMILPYDDRLAWICMVLVTYSWRKRGLATALLRHCIEQAEGRGWLPGLDATDAGRQVYLPLGFRDIFPLVRLVAEPARPPASCGDTQCRPMSEADLAAVARLDAEAAGVDRRALIGSLRDRAPALSWVAENAGGLRGFCLGRDGLQGDQLGPVVAADDGTAIALTAQALRARETPSRRIYVDAARQQSRYVAWLEGLGFAEQRGFSRMLKGRAAPLGKPAALFAIAGPELS